MSGNNNCKDANVDINDDTFRKLFIGGLNYDTTEETLKQYFGKWGEIVDHVVMKNPATKKSRGFGFITYKTAEMLDDAQNNRPHNIDDKELDTKRAAPRGSSQASVKRMFIGGLRSVMTEDVIREVFSRFGKIERLDIIPIGNTGKRKGFCYITFDDYDSVDKCVLRQRISVGGKYVEVKKAFPKGDGIGDERSSRFGFSDDNSCNSNNGYGSQGNMRFPGNMEGGRVPQGYGGGNGRSLSYSGGNQGGNGRGGYQGYGGGNQRCNGSGGYQGYGGGNQRCNGSGGYQGYSGGNQGGNGSGGYQGYGGGNQRCNGSGGYQGYGGGNQGGNGIGGCQGYGGGNQGGNGIGGCQGNGGGNQRFNGSGGYQGYGGGGNQGGNGSGGYQGYDGGNQVGNGIGGCQGYGGGGNQGGNSSGGYQGYDGGNQVGNGIGGCRGNGGGNQGGNNSGSYRTYGCQIRRGYNNGNANPGGIGHSFAGFSGRPVFGSGFAKKRAGPY